jgi:hypothetical protein
VEFASIDGNNDKIYVVYKLGNQIKARKSTDAGQSWTNIADISIGNNECSNVDIIWGKYDNALHVVWATKDNGSYDETYYRKLPSSDVWSSTETVTNYSSEVGGFPTVSVSQNRVHFSYSNFNTVKAMTRDKFITTWQIPQVAFNGQSFRERVHASTSKLFDFYYKLEGGMGNYHADIYVTERSLGGTTWSSGALLHSYNGIDNIVSSANTVDGKTHVVYDGANSVVYRSYNGTNWSSEFTVGDGYTSPKISSVSNDLFVVWGKQYPVENRYVHYRQYDAIPLTPQNLAVTSIQVGQVHHPKLTWTFNNEPDVYANDNAYEIQRRTRQVPGNFGSWSTIYYMVGNINSYTDYEIIIEGTGSLYQAEYRIRAIDVGDHISGWSSTVSIYFGQFGKINSGILQFEYQLSQNYPNPFNPTTTIDYSIESAGLITLKVYDMLGTEVASLVNEVKEAGSYSITFDASELPSGIYFYTLTSGSFMETKKLILLK